MDTLYFSLYLSADQFLAYYQGYARSVSVVAEDGRRLEFPAEHLRPYLLPDGIRGRFVIQFDRQHRLVSLQRC